MGFAGRNCQLFCASQYGLVMSRRASRGFRLHEGLRSTHLRVAIATLLSWTLLVWILVVRHDGQID